VSASSSTASQLISSTWGRFATLLTRTGQYVSQLLAWMDARQFGWIARQIQASAAVALVVVKSNTPLPVVAAELEARGWSVLGADVLPAGTYRITIRARLVHGTADEVANHALTKVRLDMAAHDIQFLRIVGEPGTKHELRRWGISLTREATPAERLAIRRAFAGRVIAGEENAARAEIRATLDGTDVRETVWDMIPLNAAAAAAHPELKPVTVGFLAGTILAAGGAVAVLIGSLLPAQWIANTDAGSITLTWFSWGIFLAATACLIAFSSRGYARRKAGRAQSWVDVLLVLGATLLPVIPLASMGGSRVGVVAALLFYVGLLALIFVVIACGRPVALLARFSAKRTARNLLVSVTTIVIVLNIPSAMFMIGAGLPNLLGSVPIGTVVVSGVVALSCVALIMAATAFGVRQFRRTSGMPPTMLVCVWVVMFSGLGLFANVYSAFANGQITAEQGYYNSAWTFGLEPVCVSEPAGRQGGTYWLAGTVGRTSYLLPRFVPGETGDTTIAIDSNQQLTYTDTNAGCAGSPGR